MKEEWNRIGEQYAKEVNDMIAFGEKNGWENWKGKHPEDNREHLAASVIDLLKKANNEGKVDEFRADFPPAHSPFIKYFEEKGQAIPQIYFIEDEKIVFVVGSPYEARQAYILDDKRVVELDASIDAIGKSKRNNVFVILSNDKIVTTQGWQGNIIESFECQSIKGIIPTQLIPFNDGKKVLFLSSEGTYLMSKNQEIMIHPVPDEDDEDWDSNVDMENMTLSNDNKYIVVGDQGYNHRVLTAEGEEIGEIGPQSEYPHYCLFSHDDSQLITNSCHFYSGTTIGVDAKTLEGILIEEYKESDSYIIIDDTMRVYAGVTSQNAYMLGDAHGYVRAINKKSECIWNHFVGSTISGLTLSDDESTLWIASYTGIIHKLKLGKGHRDKHTIGNGNHYEEFRMILWKKEPIMLW